MRKLFKALLSTLCLLSAFLLQNIYAESTSLSSPLQDVVTNAGELAVAAKDPYAASLPMMIYAELGDMAHYQSTRDRMYDLLKALDTNTDPSWKWMQNNSFKAWMWGRVLLAAQEANDMRRAAMARAKLIALLNQQPTAADNAAFAAWGWAYLAAFDKTSYQMAKKKMMDAGQALAQKYQQSGKSSDLSDVLWVWVLNIQAAARAHDQVTYDDLKAKIAGNESIATALAKGLSHTADSNDYPAWALAKVRLAAATIGDQVLFLALKAPVQASIAEAKIIPTNGAKAEYAFAVLDNKLAEEKK